MRFVLAIAIISGVAHASPITDPANDFLASFAGPNNADLDVISAQVFFDGTNFTFTSQLNGPIGTTSAALYVWGVDRGSHTALFDGFRPGVLFDAVVILTPALTGMVVDLSSNPAPPITLPAGSVTSSGNSIRAVVPASFLPSEGSAFVDYGVNLWPRTGLVNNSQIADFAPDNSDAAVTVTPEPSTAALLALVGGLLISGRLRKS